MEIYAASCLMPINGPPVAGGAIAVQGGRILAVGPVRDLVKTFAVPVREFPGSVLMPGLVNAHTHLELTHYPCWFRKNYDDSAPASYVDWIIRLIKLKRTLTLPDLQKSLAEGISISISHGTTAVADILSDRRLIGAHNLAPLSGRVYLEFIGQNPLQYAPLLTALVGQTGMIAGRFRPGLSPHAPFTVADDLLQSIAATGRELGLPLTMHLAESEAENRLFADGTGEIAEILYPFVDWQAYLPPLNTKTPTERLSAAGILDENFLAVHGVHLSANDIRLLQEAGAAVALVPRSNRNLDVGRAPAEQLAKSGMTLALGTDSLASNDSLSLWDEMRFLLDEFSGTFTPEDAVRMATVNGARAIRLEGEIGVLEAGKRADFIVMEVEREIRLDKVYEQLLDNSRLAGVWCAGTEVATAALPG